MSTDLSRLAAELLASGPHKQELTPRRVRVLFNNVFVVDSTAAQHVWEHPYYPQFYLPVDSVRTGAASVKKTKAVDGSESAFLARLSVGGRSTDRLLLFEKGPLAGLLRFEFAAMDSWFEEDQEIYGHPKDPYKRVDILPSSRTIKVAIDGQTIAESNNVMCLHETTLPTRYYLPKTSLNWELATTSNTRSLCPYKGVAEYFNITVNGKEHRDIIWWYRYPTAESITITGRICGYNEKLDIYIDGVLQERPKSKFG